MSCQENDKIMEALWEDFVDLFHTSDSFAELCVESSWYCFENLDLEVLFDALVKNDLELLLHDKRTAVEALIMWKKSANILEKIYP